MELRREEIPSGPVITGFAGTRFRIGERIYPGGLLIDPEGAAEWDAPASAATLDIAAVERLLACACDPQPEFLLLGTGASLVQPSRALARALEERGIGLEAMDSRAAARAWGVLRQEGRRVVGALMPL